jgi:M6 family metalloprotease-like protein
MLEVSYGKTFLTGNTYGWYTLAQQDDCNWINIAQGAVAEADKDVDFLHYDRLIVLVPPLNGCTGGGVAGNDHFLTNEGNIAMSVAGVRSLYGHIFIVSHELGHAFGLGHASGWECGLNTVSESCTIIGYRDPFDAMGNSTLGHFNVFEKEKVGWLAADNVRVVDRSGVFQIAPQEILAELPMYLKLHRNNDMYVYVEYRRAFGFDNNWLIPRYGSEIYDGAIIRANVFRQYIADYESMLLDMTPHVNLSPQSQFDDAVDGVLCAGQTFLDPTSEIGITTMKVEDEFLEVCVIIEPRGDFDDSGQVDLRDFASLQSCFGRKWPTSCDCLLGNYDGITDIGLVDFGFFAQEFGMAR